MTDSNVKPYTLDEIENVWEGREGIDVDKNRLHATVQALADAQKEVDARLDELDVRWKKLKNAERERDGWRQVAEFTKSLAAEQKARADKLEQELATLGSLPALDEALAALGPNPPRYWSREEVWRIVKAYHSAVQSTDYPSTALFDRIIDEETK